MLTSKKKRKRSALFLFLLFLSIVLTILLCFISIQRQMNLVASDMSKKKVPLPLKSEPHLPLTPFLTKNASFSPILIKDLAKGLCVYNVNTRPDGVFMPVLATAKVQGSDKQLLINYESEKTYLKVGIDQRLELSNRISPLYIGHEQGPDGSVLFFLHYVNHLEENEVAPIECSLKRAKKTETSLSSILKKAKFLAPDKLVELYGKSVSMVSDRLCVEQEGSGYCLNVAKGDCFVREEEVWLKVNPDELSAKKSLFQVIDIVDKFIELRIWEGEDLEGKVIKVKRHTEKPIAFKPSQSISEIKRRTLNAISCRFNKKLHVFKLGDWIVESVKGWHLVKHIEELDNIVACKQVGSMMVFDDLVQKSGKKTVVGKVFSPYRTLYSEFSLALGKESKKRPPSRPLPSRKKRTPVQPSAYDQAGRKRKL